MSGLVLQGSVVSDSSEKTIVVKVISRSVHKRYGKTISKFKKYMVHDESNEYKVGDVVKFKSCRPMSARKRWIVLCRV